MLSHSRWTGFTETPARGVKIEKETTHFHHSWRRFMKMASLHDGTPRYAVHRIIFHRTSTSGNDGHSNMLGFQDEHAEAFAPRGVQ